MEWPVFLCYRQEDGTEAARWLHKRLHGRELPWSDSTCERRAKIAMYFDVAAPGVSDWQTFHGHELARARALLVIVTPGSYTDFREKGEEDWVHREIGWWLTHRGTAPILVDTTQQGIRWVPDSIRQRWANAQLIKLDLPLWASLPEAERDYQFEIALTRIVDSIRMSEQGVRLEDFNKQMARAFVERAQRAVVDGQDLTADILMAHAYAMDREDDIRNHLLAHIHLQLEDSAGAKPYIEAVLTRQRQEVEQYLASPALVDRLALVSSTRAALDSWLLRTAEQRDHAYDAVLNFKGIVGRISLIEHRLWRRVGRKQPDVYMRVQQAHRRVSKLYRESQSGRQDAALETAIHELMLAKRSLASCVKSDPQYTAWLSTSVFDVQQRLSPSDAIVDFFRYANRYAAWIVTSTSEPVRFELGPATAIDELAARLQLAIGETRSAEYLQVGRCLYDLVWAPLSRYLEEHHLIYIVPDGNLVDIPFGVLPRGDSSIQLMEQYDLIYLFSAQQVVPWPDRVTRRERALIVSLSRFQNRQERNVFPDLPFVDLETDGIRPIVGDTVVLRGQHATEIAVKEHVQHAEIVHFATHGETIRMLDSQRSLLQVLDDPVSYIARTAELHDPLQQSALVLWDDVITARDCSYFDCDGTALVVLSTCPGRAARWSGEGTFGMARAFFEAGARNVLAATWSAHDMATSEFMISFYRGLAFGLSIPAALRSAAMRQRARPEFQHPFFWAQFSIYGPVTTQKLRSLP